jgi:hypothetical protein
MLTATAAPIAAHRDRLAVEPFAGSVESGCSVSVEVIERGSLPVGRKPRSSHARCDESFDRAWHRQLPGTERDIADR